MNKTQCPHCFTVYVISDEQLRASRGMVRCGTCKERFQAELLGQKKVEKFDPRDVFIEPISEQPNEDLARAAELMKNSGRVDIQFDGFDDDLNVKPSSDMSDSNVSANSIIDEFQHETTHQPFNEDDSAANHYEFSEESGSSSEPIFDSPPRPDIDSSALADEVSDTIDGDDGSLIDEVNQLIEKKIIRPMDTAETDQTKRNTTTGLQTREASDQGQRPEMPQPDLSSSRPATNAVDREVTEPEFSLSVKKKRPVTRWFYSLLLLGLAGLFTVGLVYQLWLKQAISWPDNKGLRNAVAPILVPVKKPIEKGLARFDITIPERRNLSKLELVSARTEPHPTRSSTILLRVSLINGAQITQALPWLELNLLDADGRLISRRNLSPDDYSYNNRIEEKVGPRELKKITIELLKFPEHATGYELKLLNR